VGLPLNHLSLNEGQTVSIKLFVRAPPDNAAIKIGFPYNATNWPAGISFGIESKQSLGNETSPESGGRGVPGVELGAILLAGGAGIWTAHKRRR
jgi:hypothetical protein